MKVKTKDRLRLFLMSIVYWILASFAYHILRRIGIGAEIGLEVVSPMSKFEGFRVAFIIGMIMGILYGVLEILFENVWLQRKSLGAQLAIKTIAYFFLLGFVINIAINYVNLVIVSSTILSKELIIKTGAIWSVTLFFILSSSFYSFLRLVNEKFGPGILMDMILGRYRSPRIEKKIFMFMDLKSSTTLAEEMGYLKYSALIQQCFYDLNEIVRKFEGQIYQYVGDEAVISWDYLKGVKENKCIDCYFEFQRKLLDRKDYYEKEFGIIPEFKAGLHGGELVVTEVGVIKKEIAYHGDVINTTARIQDQCNTFGESLLISEELINDLLLESKYLHASIGEVLLKGKLEPTLLHSVNSL